GLVNHPHAAAADFAEDTEVAKTAQRWLSTHLSVVIGNAQESQCRQDMAEGVGDDGITLGEFFHIGLPAAVEFFHERVGRFGQQSLRGGGGGAEDFIHGCYSFKPAAASRWCRRTRARPWRLRAAAESMSRMQATSWYDRPSK